jgi:GntR family transcriptional regulator, N-acetylglucosamine utilization regulator
LFYQLARKIREGIISKAYGLGELLPSEREFCEKYQVSRATVRQAFQELTKQGLIMRKQGKGTFVAEAITPNAAVYFLGDTMFFAFGLEKQGIKVNSRILGKRRLNKEEIPEITYDDTGDENFIELTRIIYGNKEPWIYDLLYLSDAYWDKDFGKRTICDILAEKGTLILDIDVVIEPIIVEKKIAESLQVPEGSPAMLVNRVFTNEKGGNSYGKAIIRGDRCQYCFRSKSLVDGFR